MTSLESMTVSVDCDVCKWLSLKQRSDAFWRFWPCNLKTNVLGAFSRYLCPKTKVFPMKFRCILEVICLQVFQKKFWAQFHDLCVQKRSSLPWSSDAFWKFSACKVYRKNSGRHFTIYVSKNEAVCCEVQTHFGSSRFVRFTEKVLGAFSRFFWFQKQRYLLCSSDAFLTFSSCMLYIKCSGRIFTIYASKNEAVCPEIQTHFRSSLPASFTEKVLGTISRFVRPKTKLFEVKFRRILKVLRLQV